MAEGIEIPAEVLSKYLNEAADTTDDPATPEPAAEPAPPETETEDTPEGESEEEVEETEEEEEAGDEEPEEEVEEEEEEEQQEDFLPPFDRKRVEKDPDLNAAYKHMQRSYTKAQQQSRAVQREAEVLRQQYLEFQQGLATDEGASELLLNVALNRPALFEQVYERAASLLNNEDERRAHDREQRTKQRELELAQRERREAARYAELRTVEITEETHALARKLGLDESEYPVVEQFVANRILENKAGTGRADATSEDIQIAVKAASRYLKAQRDAYRQKLEAERRKTAKEDVKKVAKAARRPAPPSSTAVPAASKNNRPAPPKGVDPMDYAIDLALGAVSP